MREHADNAGANRRAINLIDKTQAYCASGSATCYAAVAVPRLLIHGL